jgi:hypothetical protein
VRFVSKRGTVARFRNAQGDPDHTAKRKRADLHKPRHKSRDFESIAEHDPAAFPFVDPAKAWVSDGPSLREDA